MQHQRDGAGHDRSGRRRPAHLHVDRPAVAGAAARAAARAAVARALRVGAAVAVAAREDVQHRVGLDDHVALGGGRDEIGSGRDEIRLDDAVDERGPARAERRDRVVRAPVRSVAVDRADRDDVGQVSGREDTAVDRRARGVLAVVAGRRDDDDPRVDRGLCGLAERVVDVRLDDGGAQREVGDPDVVARPVRDHPVERGDDVARSPLALGADDAKVEQFGVEREAAVLVAEIVGDAERLAPRAGQQSGHVRSVAVRVVAVARLRARVGPVARDEVPAKDHAGLARVVDVLEVLVVAAVLVDPGVEDRDADARAVDAVEAHLPQVRREESEHRAEAAGSDDLVRARRRAHVIRVVVGERRLLDVTVERDVEHAGQRHEPSDDVRREVEREAANDAELARADELVVAARRPDRIGRGRKVVRSNDHRDRRRRIGRREPLQEIRRHATPPPRIAARRRLLDGTSSGPRHYNPQRRDRNEPDDQSIRASTHSRILRTQPSTHGK